ncbi:hypothetical protein N7495_002688 [Penicillium taxi]|uniref:uncharacterized protein n=1 Tax=Penicillium taxi TaxID=168475 RepID=UPI002545B64D|nr:uncharacterized protein N7495_002688 [Penicillium taxi]KAJ5902160.1 hypothetical protein N7495_002688 [Penicillium taxi]
MVESSAESLALISSNRFHRTVTLDTKYGSLNFSFADVGSTTGPTLLFIPGMFSSRYNGIRLHLVAERAGVRILTVDRPGMGASTDVPLSQRIAVWVDMLPRLLAHLGISHVSLVSHSNGTMYLLNTWAQCPPWVDPAHSQVTTWQMAKYIPAKAFALWHHIPRFVVTQAGPVFASSNVLINMTRNSSKEPSDQGNTEQAELSRLASRFMWDENTVGANSEALTCLRKGDSDWAACSDYAQCAQTLATRESSGGSFKVRAYFAAKDAMIGGRGQRYFEQCWQAPGMDAIDFASKTVDGTDHDSLVESMEVWEAILSSIK